ncbi:YbaB/EbfC family nucleoid-associated protein [Magnetospira thiophila]
MKNLGQMMKQAQKIQERMQEMQQELAEAEVEGRSGAGMVVVTLNGKSEMKRLRIDPSLVDPADVGVLEDLVVAAHADAKGKAEQMMKDKMSELTGGLPLPPGMTLPF